MNIDSSNINQTAQVKQKTSNTTQKILLLSLQMN